MTLVAEFWLCREHFKELVGNTDRANEVSIGSCDVCRRGFYVYLVSSTVQAIEKKREEALEDEELADVLSGSPSGESVKRTRQWLDTQLTVEQKEEVRQREAKSRVR